MMKVKQLKYYLDDLSKRIKDFDDYTVDIYESGGSLDWLEQIQVLDHKIVLYRDDDCYVSKKGIYPIIDKNRGNYYEKL